ncbi:MAG TPA: RsmB/NOP family class I SAM-dependent RNA methyltransferase [Caulobacteraceae bacterium]|nr:RsmB/NOP family class I SAM-dependent RNA methyltransferase [Caulobacteraceae bacterium]
MATTPGLAARRAALGLLTAALQRRGGLETALAGPALGELEVEDRAFARALCMVTLRALGPVDRALDRRLTRPPPERVRHILRLALTGAWRLRTPPFAAVDTAVALAPKAFKGLVNAVLRRALEAGPPGDDPEVNAPAWLFARWAAAFGRETALAIAREIASEPPTDLTLRDPSDSELAPILEARPLGCGSLRTERGGDPAAWPGFDQGRWWVQDFAAAMPARLLAPARGETVLDLCSAPGGKALQLAAADARVTALDRSAERLKRLQRNLHRTGLRAEIVVADALAWADPRTFAAALVDAPCSATGTFRRHPDVLWNVRPSEIAVLAGLQGRLLDAAAAHLATGGRLVYAVCSLEREEGEDQARAFLRRSADFRLDPVAPGEAGAPAASLAPEGWLRILPHHIDGGLDGFFIARFARV